MREVKPLEEYRDPVLPGHKGSESDHPNPWEDAARVVLNRVVLAARRLHTLDLPTPGEAREEDVTALGHLAASYELTSDLYAHYRDRRRERAADRRRRERAADRRKKS